MGTETFTENATVDRAEGPGYDVIFVDGSLLAMVVEGEPFLTIRGILRYGASKRYVTVDMGAVKFIANGADVMGPGILEAEDSVAEGALAWIRDEKNKRPLAIGRSLASARDLRGKPRGKGVLSLHHVGDKLWSLEEEGQP